MPLLTPAQLQLYSTYDFSQQSDAFVALMINRAQVLVDAFCVNTTYTGSSTGSLLELQTWSEQLSPVVDQCCNLFVQLNHRPVTEVTSATLTSIDTSSEALTVSDMRVNREAGYFEYPTCESVLNRIGMCPGDVCEVCTDLSVDVTYEAGYDPIPEDLMKATAMIAEQITLTATASSGSSSAVGSGILSSFRTGSYAESYETLSSAANDVGLNIPQNILEQAELILLKYKQGPASLARMAGVV